MRKRALRRALCVAAGIVGTTATFAVATAGGVVLHLQTAAARRLTATTVNRMLGPLFRGSLTIAGVTRLGLGGVSAARVTIRDPNGVAVLSARDVRGDIELTAALRSLLHGTREIELDVTRVHVDDVDVLVVMEPDGLPSLAHAFDPKTISTEAPDPNARGVAININNASVAHVHAGGALSKQLPLDVDITAIAGAFRFDHAGTTIDVGHLSLAAHGMPEGIDPIADARARVRLPSAPDDSVDASWSLAGVAARQPLTTHGKIAGSRVDAFIDVPFVDPQTLREVVSESPLHEGASLHLEAHGTLPAVSATAHLTVGPGTIDLRAGAHVATETTATLALTASGIDARSFAPGMDRTTLSAKTTATVELSGGTIAGRFDLETSPATIAGQPIPRASVHARFTGDTVSGSALVDEEGAPADVDFKLHPGAQPGSSLVLDFDARVTATDLGRVTRLARAASGSARVRAHGRIELAEARIVASASADVDQLAAAHGELHVGTGRVDATVQGPFAALAIDGHVAGTDLSFGGQSFKAFDVQGRGGMHGGIVTASLRGGDAPDVQLHARVAIGAVTTVKGAEIGLQRKDVRLVARVGDFEIGGPTTRLDDVVIEGIGGAPVRASMSMGAGAVAVNARGDDVDLGRIGRLLGQETNLKGGHVTFAAFVTATRARTAGSVMVELRKGSFPHAQDANGTLEASVFGRKVHAKVRGSVGDVGSVTVAADDVLLGGRIQDPTSWQTAVGHVLVDADVNLAKLSDALPKGTLPIQQASGTVHLVAKAGRERAADRPDLDAEVSTHRLGFVASHGASTYTSKDTDVEAALHVDGSSQQARMTARVHDRKGPLAALEASVAPPLDRILRGGAFSIADAERLPVHLGVFVPRRDIADLPAMADVTDLHGALEAALTVDGSASAPRVELKARAFDVTGSNAVAPTRVNVDVLGTYDGKAGKLVVKVARPEGFVADVTADARAPLAALVGRTTGAPAWDASLKGTFRGMPLDVLPGLASNRVHGTVTGDLSLSGLHRSAAAAVDLRINGLRVEQTRYKGAHLTARASDGTVHGTVRIDQDDGFAEAQLDAGLSWGAEVVPSIDVKRAVSARVSAKGLQIAAAQPFIQDTVSELEGRVDADARLSYDPEKKKAQAQGSLSLRDGLFEMPGAGGEFHAVQAKVTMDPTGVVRVDDLSANGASGRLTGSATVKLDGLRVRSAEAKIAIKRGEKLPVEVSGTPLGRVWGSVALSAQVSSDGKDVNAKVTVPQLTVTLPQSIGHSVQDLDPNRDVKIGVIPSDSALQIVPLAKPVRPTAPSSTRTHLVVALGGDVWVTRDTMLKLQLHDGPVVDIGSRTVVSGRITAGPGTIELQSKKFELDHASVAFVGKDPSAPQIVASAHWDAPDKTRVIVEVTGTPDHLNINFHSEPDQLPKDAILSLILFGDQNGSFGSTQASPSGDNEDVNQAAGVAGGVLTQGVNKAISGVTSADITTRVDTSESQNPRPELAVQITKDVSATVAYNLGLPPPGQNPDRTEVILDYRFIRDWSLITTFGDAGSTIADLLWQYRY